MFILPFEASHYSFSLTHSLTHSHTHTHTHTHTHYFSAAFSIFLPATYRSN